MNVPDVKWIVSQLGAREHYAVPRVLLQHLDLFYTDIWMGKGRSFLSRLPESLGSLQQRYHQEIPQGKVISFNRTFLIEHVLQKTGSRKFQSFFDKDIYYGSLFARKVRDHLKARELKDHYFLGFSTASLETLIWLKDKGVKTIVDQIDPGRVELEIVLQESLKWKGCDLHDLMMHSSYYVRMEA